jgi:hypothetical protein
MVGFMPMWIVAPLCYGVGCAMQEVGSEKIQDVTL